MPLLLAEPVTFLGAALQIKLWIMTCTFVYVVAQSKQWEPAKCYRKNIMWHMFRIL